MKWKKNYLHIIEHITSFELKSIVSFSATSSILSKQRMYIHLKINTSARIISNVIPTACGTLGTSSKTWYRPWRQPRRTIPRTSESWRRILPLISSGLLSRCCRCGDFTKRYPRAGEESLDAPMRWLFYYCRDLASSPRSYESRADGAKEKREGGRRKGRRGNDRAKNRLGGRACEKESARRSGEEEVRPLRPLSSFEVHERLRRTKRRRAGYSLPFLLSRGVLPFPVEARNGGPLHGPFTITIIKRRGGLPPDRERRWEREAVYPSLPPSPFPAPFHLHRFWR